MRWLIVVCCLLMLGACTQKTKAPQEPIFAENDAVAAAASVEDENYVIEAGDFLDVRAPSSPKANCIGRVREDGTVALALVRYVRAEGSTIAQFTQTLSELYTEVPGYEGGVGDLTVEVKLGLYLITGKITSGGFRAYKEGLTLYDAVTSGGEITGKAEKGYVKLFRKGAEGPEIVRYKDIEQLKQLPLEENDWVVVPHKVEHLLH